jgi:hypothetical protein
VEPKGKAFAALLGDLLSHDIFNVDELSSVTV